MGWRGARILLIWVGGGAVALLALALLMSKTEPSRRPTFVERAQAACDRQFGAGTDDSLNCQITLNAHRREGERNERLRQAAREAQ